MGLLLYFYFIIPKIANYIYNCCEIFFWISIISVGIIGLILLIYNIATDDDEEDTKLRIRKIKKVIPYLIKVIIVTVIVNGIMTFIPNKKEIAVIYVIPKIAENKDIQEIPANIAKLANEGLKEFIEITKEMAKEK